MARPPRPETETGSGGAMDSNQPPKSIGAMCWDQPIKPIQPGLG